MVAIVYQTDKRSGITYAYQSISRWDKEKKLSRAKRTLIGRVDKVTGEIIPTDGRNRKKQDEQSPANCGPKPAAVAHRSFFGATYLLDAIGEKVGITDDLKQCFPDSYRQILSIAYYLILEESIPLYRFEKWGILHGTHTEKCLVPRVSVSYFQAYPKRTNKNSLTFRGNEGSKMSSGLMIQPLYSVTPKR